MLLLLLAFLVAMFIGRIIDGGARDLVSFNGPSQSSREKRQRNAGQVFVCDIGVVVVTPYLFSQVFPRIHSNSDNEIMCAKCE